MYLPPISHLRYSYPCRLLSFLTSTRRMSAPAPVLPTPLPRSPIFLTRSFSLMLAHHVDRFNGVIINPTELPNDPNRFKKVLCDSLMQWSTEDRRGIWLQIPITHSAIIPVAAEEGFVYHHAKDNYAMMTLWLPHRKVSLGESVPESNPPSSICTSSNTYISASLPSMIPAYHTSSLGVGAFVVCQNIEDGEIYALTIREKFAVQQNMWKCPGGAVDNGETLIDATVRECFEETGVKCEFVEILAFRHLLQYRFDGMDCYHVCLCKADGGKGLPKLAPQESEIAEAKWIPVFQFLNYPSIQWMAPHVYKAVCADIQQLFPEYRLPASCWTDIDRLEKQSQPHAAENAKFFNNCIPYSNYPKWSGFIPRVVTSATTGVTSLFYVSSATPIRQYANKL